ncbi:hypothetical protein [Streptomyces sp. NPDC006668]|uniref:hypothetical protein n=1 Tax=Streptomyces sp. NPDC006668 TaxID=3156903 RepID=UPI0033F06CF9
MPEATPEPADSWKRYRGDLAAYREACGAPTYREIDNLSVLIANQKRHTAGPVPLDKQLPRSTANKLPFGDARITEWLQVQAFLHACHVHNALRGRGEDTVRTAKADVQDGTRLPWMPDTDLQSWKQRFDALAGIEVGSAQPSPRRSHWRAIRGWILRVPKRVTVPAIVLCVVLAAGYVGVNTLLGTDKPVKTASTPSRPSRSTATQAAEASLAAQDSKWEKTLAVLRRAITPAPKTSIGCTATVSGTGFVPDGWDIWAANLNDINGRPDTSEFFHWTKAPHPSGDNEWTTPPFPVGFKDSPSSHFWIFVYLVPQAAGSVIDNVELPKDWSVTLRAPISGSIPLAKTPVERATTAKCG